MYITASTYRRRLDDRVRSLCIVFSEVNMGFCFSSPKKKDVLADSNQILADNVERLYDAVKYMTPTTIAGAIQADKKIGALAGDLKIVLSKGERTLVKAADIVGDLDTAIVERNSYTK